ncbi:MAG TPA: SRPBCC family protein [Iamia sp.]|nr:SRPBCC family protein [Iamia sp.]
MELTNTFTVSSPIDEMWPILCDIERIAPCMPGAQLTEVEGEEYRGEVKLKVGPINARFKGTARLVERDDSSHRAVLKASGKDTGGKGNANATITASAVSADGGGTEVTITTDLSITGKVAQFGRSAMNDISNKLLGQFVTCLETKVLAGEDVSAEPAAESSSPSPSPSEDEPVVDVTEGASGAASAGPGSPVETAPAPAAGGVPTGTAATGGGAAAGATTSSSSGGARTIDAPEPEPIDLLDAAAAPVAKKLALPVAAVMAVFFALYWRRRRK